MRLHSPQWVAVAATVMVVGGGVTAGYMHWHGGESAAPKATAEVPVQPGMEEAHAVATALGRLADKPADLVATDVQSAIGARAPEAVPKGATVTANESSWHPDGLGGGTMTVTIAPSGGTPPTTYSAIMVKEPTGWKVVGTMPMVLTGTSSAPAGVGQAPAAQAPAAQNPAGTKATPVNPTTPDGKTAGSTTGTTTGRTKAPATPKKPAPKTQGAGR